MREFEFTPIVSGHEMKETDDENIDVSKEDSVWNCDGEVITAASIRVKIHCQLLPVFGTGRENRLTGNSGLGLTSMTVSRKIHDVNENRLKRERMQSLPVELTAAN